jgi:hypothetical protein
MDSMNIEYFEDLVVTGITCPPTDAFSPNGELEYYRVLKNNPPVSDNFLPTILKEGKPKPDACISKAVSIYDNLQGLINGYFRTPAGKKKKSLIGELKLKPEDGMLKQTFAAGHHSWWRSKEFDPASVTVREVEYES